MQSKKLSEVVVSPCKEPNVLNKGKIEIDQVNDVGFAKDTTIEDDFASPIPCTYRSVDEIVYTHILEIRQASNKSWKDNITNAII